MRQRLLVDVLCTHESDEVLKTIEAFYSLYGKELDRAVTSETSGDFKSLLKAVLSCLRPSCVSPVTADLVRADAKAFFDAGENKIGTNESKFIELLCARARGCCCCWVTFLDACAGGVDPAA